MQRITLSLDDELAKRFDRLIANQGYANRSEAFRDIVRELLNREAQALNPKLPAIGVVSYVFNHHERQLSARLAEQQHEHTHSVISTMHVHLNHDECVESVVVKGTLEDIQAVAEGIITAPGVRHGHLNLIPAVKVNQPEGFEEPDPSIDIAEHGHVHYGVGDHHHEHPHPKGKQ